MIRSLIVWLVLLALPFQGFAAAAAMPCAALTRAASAQPAQAGAVMHRHAAMLHHGHAKPAAAGAGHHAGTDHHAGAKCGSCAACWVGAAMAGASAAIGAQQAPSATIPFDAGHLPSVHPRLPERPPRPLIA